MRKLLIDIETAPNQVHVWGLWGQNVGINQIITPGYTMCYSAKWVGERGLIFDSIFDTKPEKMVRGVHKLISEADAVITYNGVKFDLPTLNKEFVLYGLEPPSPYKNIDLLKVAKRQFRFPSNKLDYISRELGLGSKVKHKGHDLWIECMRGDPKAWKTMTSYCKQDVVLLEKLYHRLLPWIHNHPNHSLYDPQDTPSCTNCGSTHLQSRGYAYTNTLRYRRYRCNDCGSWNRSRTAERLDEELRNSILVRSN